MTFCYADPPYPGRAWMYRDQPDYGGEVDHAALLAQLEDGRHAGRWNGWALSTASDALQSVLPLCPENPQLCAWVKPRGVGAALRATKTWEPVIVVGGRAELRRVRDWLRAFPARGGGTLIGRKPLAFALWLFQLFGMRRHDRIVELFPGTAMVTRAWAELHASPSAGDDASLEVLGDASPAAASDD